MAANTLGVPVVGTNASYTTGSVKSKDGTTIGYRQLGRGPGVIVLHGSVEAASSHMELAEEMANSYTVYLVDRRGRGLSGPFGSEYSVQEDMEDLDALLHKTGARLLFGVSSGAIISLQAALTFPALDRIAIYEPPLFSDKTEPQKILKRFDQEMAEGKVNAALVTAMQGAQMGPSFMLKMPRPFLEFMTARMNSKGGQGGDSGPSFYELAPTIHYDFALVNEMSGTPERFRQIKTPVLLLGGSDSPAYLKNALGMLEKVVPDTKRVEFAGLGHGGSGNRNMGGKPERVAEQLEKFFV